MSAELPALCVARAHDAASWLSVLVRAGSAENTQALATNTHFDAATWQAGLVRTVAPWADAAALVDAMSSDIHGEGALSAVRPSSALVVLGGVLPPSHLQAVLRPWLLGAEVLVKAPNQDLGFPAYLAASLPGVRLIDRDEVTPWSASVDAVVVVGGDDAVRAIGAHVPLATPFLGYGDRPSIGFTDAAPSSSAVAGFADDVLLYDQRGCLSLRELWVTGEPAAVAERLADRLRGSPPRPPLGALEDRLRRFPDLAVTAGAVVHAERVGQNSDWRSPAIS